jgi:[DsrC]-trisulfide reductase subunit J
MQPVLAGDGGNLQPKIEKATRGERCVADPAFMRRNHMDLLKHQRDDTVRGGIRGAKYSLGECIGCHASAKTDSVAQAPSDFCVSCHRYAAVSIDCFECHSSKPRAVALKNTP